MAIFRERTIADYEAVSVLLRNMPGTTWREADSRVAIERYLLRNPGLSFVAEEEGSIVGCAFCGHDGRRGYLQHVAVNPAFRRRGIAATLVSRCLDGLDAVGIAKTHIDVLLTNEEGRGHWERQGWQRRDDVVRYSFNRSGNPNV